MVGEKAGGRKGKSSRAGEGKGEGEPARRFCLMLSCALTRERAHELPGQDVSEQVGHGLRVQGFLETFRHEGQTRAGQLLEAAAQQHLLIAAGTSHRDTVSRLGCDYATDLAIALGNGGIIDRKSTRLN